MTPGANARSDARWVRAHAALRDAVLSLAAKHPIADISLAQLAAEAGVSRSTAYEHAASARELLEAALVTELDAARDTHLRVTDASDIGEATSDTTAAVTTHIDRYSDIYRIGLAADAGASSLAPMLAKHFSASVRLLLETGGIDHGIGEPGSPERLAVDALVARGIADSAVGQYAAWVALPAPRDHDLFARVNAHLLPEWWPTEP